LQDPAITIQNNDTSVVQRGMAINNMHKLSTLTLFLKYGIASFALAAITATESEGVTKKLDPKIIFLSPSPEQKLKYITINIKIDKTLLYQLHLLKI
jgi:hypothetical protein